MLHTRIATDSVIKSALMVFKTMGRTDLDVVVGTTQSPDIWNTSKIRTKYNSLFIMTLQLEQRR
jgi:hypothetical protein